MKPKTQCDRCESASHGGRYHKDFLCFQCWKLTEVNGDQKMIKREEGIWLLRMKVPQKNNKLHVQWVAISDDYEEVYQQYLSRLIVS